MSVEIHGMSLSAPCRICYMTCEVLGIDYKMITCDLMKGENKSPEYLKVSQYQLYNPQRIALDLQLCLFQMTFVLKS